MSNLNTISEQASRAITYNLYDKLCLLHAKSIPLLDLPSIDISRIPTAIFGGLVGLAIGKLIGTFFQDEDPALAISIEEEKIRNRVSTQNSDDAMQNARDIANQYSEVTTPGSYRRLVNAGHAAEQRNKLNQTAKGLLNVLTTGLGVVVEYQTQAARNIVGTLFSMVVK